MAMGRIPFVFWIFPQTGFGEDGEIVLQSWHLQWSLPLHYHYFWGASYSALSFLMMMMSVVSKLLLCRPEAFRQTPLITIRALLLTYVAHYEWISSWRKRFCRNQSEERVLK
jgi:hypothetical protein